MDLSLQGGEHILEELISSLAFLPFFTAFLFRFGRAYLVTGRHALRRG
jgi:hypothetical protein